MSAPDYFESETSIPLSSFPTPSESVPGGSGSPPSIQSATIPTAASAGTVAVSERFLDPIELQIPRVQDTEETFRDASIVNFRRLEDWLQPYGGRERNGLRLLAQLLGGQYLEVDVAQVAAGVNGDTEIDHDLGRIPSQIVIQTDLRGFGGLVRGAPSGGLGASGTGSNENAWTDTKIYLRADVTSTYGLVVT